MLYPNAVRDIIYLYSETITDKFRYSKLLMKAKKRKRINILRGK